MIRCVLRVGYAAIVSIALATNSEARVTQIVIEARDAATGAKPDAIPYEILRGHFEGELDPADAHNEIITDLASAPRNAHGQVTYSATFAIAKPIDLARASGVLLYEVPNRGNGRVAADADGHVRVISGWQGDIVPQSGLQTATVPTATGPHGSALTAPVFARFLDMAPGTNSLLVQAGFGAPVSRPIPVSLDTHRARLFRQATDQQPQTAVASGDWAFADCRAVPFPGTPDPSRVCLRGGFDPSFAYGLVYEGRDPKVLGIGFAATRDLNAFLRHGTRDDKGTPNPLAGAIRWTVASGNSQSGNFLKSFVNLGFNADEQGRIVFDGLNPNIAARQVPLNQRFGVPGGAASLYEAGSEGNLWWTRYEDRPRGRGSSSLLDRCNRSKTCPKIIETFGSAEFWGLHMSPGLVGTDASSDLPLPPNVRRYYFPSVTHGGSMSGGFPVKGDALFPGAPKCQLAGNPNPSADTLRALQKHLLQWVAADVPPPMSRYPTLAAGDLVAPNAKAMGWPAIPAAPLPDDKINIFFDNDFGPGFHYADISGVATRQPPRIRAVIPQLVPRVDQDGNENSGVASVQLLVPIGTYTGWNVLAEGYGHGRNCGFIGGFIPFARTRAERLAVDDPRASLEERYVTHQGFVDAVRRVAASRVADGWLLPDDATRLIAQAEASDVLRN
jgi:hypothetical protein